MFDFLIQALDSVRLSHKIAKIYKGDECFHGWLMEYSFLAGNCTILLANNKDKQTIQIKDITKITQHDENLITTVLYQRQPEVSQGTR